jgi:hypothetical protein
MTNPRKDPATRNATAIPRPTPLPLKLLRLSITDQIEAVLLRHPQFESSASREVDALLVCFESLGGTAW